LHLGNIQVTNPASPGSKLGVTRLFPKVILCIVLDENKNFVSLR